MTKTHLLTTITMVLFTLITLLDQGSILTCSWTISWEIKWWVKADMRSFMMISTVITLVWVGHRKRVHLIGAEDIVICLYFCFIIQKTFKMDSLIALKGKDFVIIAADTTNAYSVLRMKVSLRWRRTTTIKSGTLMVKNCLPLEASIPTSWSLETTSKKILLSCNIKTGTNFLLMTQLSSSDPNTQKPSEKDPTVSTVFWQVSKVINPGCTGLTISAQRSRQAKHATDMLNFWPQVCLIPFKPRTWLKNKELRSLTTVWTRWERDSLWVRLHSPSR